MNLKTCILKNNDCYKANKTITPKGIMVHSTAANNPNLKRYVQPNDGVLGENRNGNHWNRAGVGKCVHAFIGKGEDGTVYTYQTLLWNWRGWHAGGTANNTHIGFEVCEDALTDEAYFNAVYKEAVELSAMLCETYKLDPKGDGAVISHKEGYARGVASNHGDIDHWLKKFGKSMDDFREDVAKKMNEKNAEPVYNTIQEVPEWGRPTIQKLVDKKLLLGDENGLNLSYDLLRTLVILDRTGVFE